MGKTRYWLRTNARLASGAILMEKYPALEMVEAAELIKVDGGLLFDDRVVIIGCTTPPPVPRPGQVTWNPWLGQPYPMPM